jgi:hypothetical protein
MGGSSGGVIIRQNAAVILSDPVVHGALPKQKRDLIDPVLAKAEPDWDEHDRWLIAKVHAWALCHLK